MAEEWGYGLAEISLIDGQTLAIEWFGENEKLRDARADELAAPNVSVEIIYKPKIDWLEEQEAAFLAEDAARY